MSNFTIAKPYSSESDQPKDDSVVLYRKFVDEIIRMYTSAQNAQQLLHAIETDSVDMEQVKNCLLGFSYESFNKMLIHAKTVPILCKIDRKTTTLHNANGRWESWLGDKQMYPAGTSDSQS